MKGFSNSIANQRGFTLIELLVVLVIISMFSGMIVLSIGDNFSRELRGEAERFQRLVVAATDEAIYTSSQLGVVIDKNSYSLVRLDTVSQSWQPFNTQAFRMHSLPESMKMTWSVDGFTRPGTEDAPQDLSFGDDAVDANNNDDESDGSGLNLTPQLLMLSSGEVSVFSVEFSAADNIANNQIVEVLSDGFSVPSIQSIVVDSLD
ncbi:MAG: type II secretion system minor pseudopilin GspH [Pseudomonadales bacterium]|nr:type II secretion system minor pseudopilin GspH [Pseudomonadales bacterium]